MSAKYNEDFKKEVVDAYIIHLKIVFIIGLHLIALKC